MIAFSFNLRIMVHEQSIDKLTAVWLLPVVAPIVAASTGANLCTVIPQDWSALHPTLIASYVLWGMGFPFAMSILVLYIHRLTVYNVVLCSYIDYSSLPTKLSLVYSCQSVHWD
jgi:tellurite resistance protein TehA-like permease